MSQDKICLICKIKLVKRENENKTNFNKRKYCSRICYWKSMEGEQRNWLVGKQVGFNQKHTKETKEKISKSKLSKKLLGEKSASWKGRRAGIKPKHQWVVRNKGKASSYKCKCGSQAEDWSNKDHMYSRNLEDYTALCRKCHREYDKNNNNS